MARLFLYASPDAHADRAAALALTPGISGNAAFCLAHSGFLNLSWNIGEQPVTINLGPSHY
jgi:hypothetical protein